MQQAVQDGRRQGAVVVKNLRPVLEGAVRGDQRRALLIAQADDLKEQVGAGLVNGEVAEFIEDEQGGLGVFFELGLEPSGPFGLVERVNDINGAGKEHRMALETSRIAKRRGQMRFSKSHVSQIN